MKKAVHISSLVFIGISILSVAYVSIISMINPQGTMDLVQVSLPNNDAISSIRGIYGGVGLAITASLIYLLLKNVPLGLSFLTMFWGFYALIIGLIPSNFIPFWQKSQKMKAGFGRNF